MCWVPAVVPHNKNLAKLDNLQSYGFERPEKITAFLPHQKNEYPRRIQQPNCDMHTYRPELLDIFVPASALNPRCEPFNTNAPDSCAQGC